MAAVQANVGSTHMYGHHQHQQQYYLNHSVMEDVSDNEDDDDDDDDHDHGEGVQGYHTGAGPSGGAGYQNGHPEEGDSQEGAEGEGAYSDDDDSSTASIPDENIDFSLTYALHTFLATVEGQASVVKGDSLLLLDDANSYWWLVRVLKTEDVGYIPAENIETPYERLARLNKHRNVDIAAATMIEKNASSSTDREKFKAIIMGKSRKLKRERSGEGSDEPRKVEFAPPTYVEHPGVTWSSDEEDEDADEEYAEGEMELGEEDGEDEQEQERSREMEVDEVESALASHGAGGPGPGSLAHMEPDDGVEWADAAGRDHQRRAMDARSTSGSQAHHGGPQPQSNNPFALRSTQTHQPPAASASNTSLASSNGVLDPAQAGMSTKRITVTPAVAQGGGAGVLLPSAIVQGGSGQQAQGSNQYQLGRNVSGQSVASTQSTVSAVSTQRSSTPTSPQEDSKKGKSSKKVKDDGEGGEKKRKGVLSGLFSRKKDKNKEKKGISNTDPRSSEESMVSGAIEGTSPASQGRASTDESPHQRAPTPADRRPTVTTSPNGPQQPQVSQHGRRLQQRDQMLQQSYSNKYLKTSPSTEVYSPTAQEAAAAVAQSAAAMRLSAMQNGVTNRPASIIISPNPAAPLLNVIRVFAGDYIKSEASFKTVLLNETTSSTDLVRQALQRFRIPGAGMQQAETPYYLTIKDVGGEEMELAPHEIPLAAFQEAVQRWSEDDDAAHGRGLTATVKRSSITSISSIASLSSHPAIAKLGMNDFSDDSAVKIYLNRRRPGSSQPGMPEPASEFSSYSTQLSTVHEASPETKDFHRSDNIDSPPDGSAGGPGSDGATVTPPTPRYNGSLTVNTGLQASPERFSSPSTKFTIQLVIHPGDLPESSVFDPASDIVISRSTLRDRQAAGHPNTPTAKEPRRRIYQLPRNATVVEAIEQGLSRFGIHEGVVHGGDDVDDKAGARRNGPRARYALVAVRDGHEQTLSPSSKVLDSYSSLPNLRPVERTTPEQRRRSRDFTQSAGSPNDILPSDPVFMLRRVDSRVTARKVDAQAGALQLQQQELRQSATWQPDPSLSVASSTAANGALSPQEIIAAQRAASRATQKALISAQANQSQGVDVVLPDKGTLRSSRLLEPNGAGDVVRYSYIDDDGETYDISELLEEEWGADGSKLSPMIPQPPSLLRQATDQSNYVTAPSTPEPTSMDKPILGLSQGLSQVQPRPNSAASGSYDILHTVVQRAAGQPDGKLEEKLQRVIEKVKSGSVRLNSSQMDEQRTSETGRLTPSSRPTSHLASSPGAARESSSRSSQRYSQTNGEYDENATPRSSTGRITPQTFSFPAPPASGQSTPQPSSRILSPLPEDRAHDLTPRATDSRQANYQQTAATVNRIISRHRQQPSIASIMSDLSGHNNQVQDDEVEGSSTPLTATSSTHPTPPMHPGFYTRALSTSPTPRSPVVYQDDFGIKTLMAIVEARAREHTPRRISNGIEQDEAERLLYGERVEMSSLHPEVKGCITGLQDRLDAFDRDIDALLAEVAGVR